MSGLWLLIFYPAAEDTLASSRALPSISSRLTYYSHAEVAKLVRWAYRARNDAISSIGHKTPEHLGRFILIAVHTGIRVEKIEQASFENGYGRPSMDVESGIFIGQRL